MWSGSSQQQLHLLVPVSALVTLHTVVIKCLTSSNLKEEGYIPSYKRKHCVMSRTPIDHLALAVRRQRTGSEASVYNFNAHHLYPTFSGKALSLKDSIHSLPKPAGNQVSRHMGLSEMFHNQTTRWSSWSPPYPYYYLLWWGYITCIAFYKVFVCMLCVCVSVFINMLALT